MGWKMVYNFLGYDEKTPQKSLLSFKTSMWKKSLTFFHRVYPNKNHVTTHPASYCLLSQKLTVQVHIKYMITTVAIDSRCYQSP